MAAVAAAAAEGSGCRVRTTTRGSVAAGLLPLQCCQVLASVSHPRHQRCHLRCGTL